MREIISIPPDHIISHGVNTNVSIPSGENMSQRAKCLNTPLLYTTFFEFSRNNNQEFRTRIGGGFHIQLVEINLRDKH